MNAPKKPQGSFTSLRIIGEKAQKLLQRARDLQAQKKPDAEPPVLPEEPQHEQMIVHVSVGSIAKATLTIIAILASAALIVFLRDKLVLLILAMFLATIMDPAVELLTRRGIPRSVAVLLYYVVTIFLLVFFLISLIPIIATQLGGIARIIANAINAFIHDPTINLPLVPADVNAQLTTFAESTLQSLSIEKVTDALDRFSQSISSAAQGSLIFAAQVAKVIVEFFVSLIIVLVLAFFIQLEKEKIFAWLRSFLPRRYRVYIDSKSELIHFKLGQWARGQLVLCVSIGLLVFIALVILRMPYALTLALLAGFTEFIPVVGPLFAAIPSVLIGFTQHGFLWAIVVAVVYYIIQWCENNLLVPLIMKRAVGLSPIAIIFAMLVGISFPQIIHPVLGVILSIPTTTIITLFLEDWRYLRSQREKRTA